MKGEGVDKQETTKDWLSRSFKAEDKVNQVSSSPKKSDITARQRKSEDKLVINQQAVEQINYHRLPTVNIVLTLDLSNNNAENQSSDQCNHQHEASDVINDEVQSEELRK